jgi:hypothetical protein
MPVPRKYGKSLVSMVEKCHTELSEVLWSCRRPCCHTSLTAHARNKEKKSFRASKEYYEIVKKRMSLHNEKRIGDSASANVAAATKYLQHFRMIIDGIDDLPARFQPRWHKPFSEESLSPTFRSKKGKISPGIKILLCDSVTGNFMIRPIQQARHIISVY